MPKETAGRTDLVGLRVLIAEDQLPVATVATAILVSQGCASLGLVRSVEEGLAVLADGPPPDVALLNVRLGGRSTAPLAAALVDRGVPFLVVTAEPDASDPLLRQAPRLRVPFTPRLLVRTVVRVIRAPPAGRE